MRHSILRRNIGQNSKDLTWLFNNII